jgi:hypothetical protein
LRDDVRARIALFLVCSWILASEPALAQEAQLTAASHARVLELLALNCSTEGEGLRFRLVISEIGSAAEPLLLEVLERGIPPEIRKRAEEESIRQYAMRQAWLANDGERVFGADAARLAKRSATDFVADALRRLDALFKQNALRALAVAGTPAAIPVIRAAAAREAHLAAPAQDAVAAISAGADRKSK